MLVWVLFANVVGLVKRKRGREEKKISAVCHAEREVCMRVLSKLVLCWVCVLCCAGALMLPSDGFDVGVWGFGCGKIYVIGAQGVRAAG